MNPRLTRILIFISIPLTYAFLVHFIFGVNSWQSLFSIMSISFIFLVPAGIGALAVYFSDIEKVKSLAYRIFAPWIPIFIFLILTLAFSMEGWACWIMILPLFLLFASIGVLTAGYFKLRKNNRERTYITFVAFLPFLLSPAERAIGNINNQYEAYTYIDISSDRNLIWDNVTRVAQISRNEDTGWLTNNLGFPRPIKAELNFNGVGAYRKAVFDKGLVFNENVMEYRHGREMKFTITTNPYNIPAATMDQHVVIGGKYFNVSDGTYILEKKNNGAYRLHLFSHFTLKTTFNFYASVWAGWIMKDIQNNILRVIKKRSEHS